MAPIARAAAGAVALAGSLGLLGWLLDIAVLKSVLPGLATMKANTALGFVLAGLSLGLSPAEPADRARWRTAQVCASVVALLGLATLGEYLLGRDLGIDELLVRDPTESVGTSSPGRMAPATALGLSLLGAALLLLNTDSPRGHRLAQILALAAALMALAALVGYAYGVQAVYAVAAYASMALHTALAIAVLSAGILAARPQHGVMALVTSPHEGGVLARHVLPAALVVPFALGWLRLAGERAGLYETEFGLSLMVMAVSVAFTVLVLVSAWRLDRSAVRREQAAGAVRRSEANYRELLQSAPDAIVIADGTGSIVLVNTQAERAFGYRRDELLGRPVETLLPERVRTAHVGHRQAYQAAPRVRPMGSGLDLVARRKDGSEFPVEVSLSPLTTEEGSLVMSAIRDITERRRAEAEIQRRQREAEELARVARAFTETLDVGEVGRRVVDSVVLLFAATIVRLRLLQPDGSLRAVAWAGRAPEHAEPDNPLPRGTGIAGRVAVEGIPVWSSDALRDPGVVLDDETRRVLETSDQRAILGVPLQVKGQTIGSLTIGDRTGRAFSEAEVALLRTFADQAALALENARLYDDAQRRRRAAERLVSASRSLSTSLDSDAVGRQVVESVRALLGAQLATLYRLDPNSGGLSLVAGSGVDALLALPPGTGIAGLAVRTGGLVTTPDLLVDPRVTLSPEARALVEQAAFRAALAMPLFLKDRVIGALAVGDRPGRVFDPEEIGLAQAFADQAALALENARLVAGLEARVAERTAELEAANRELEAFAYSVSHDLRAPLRAIDGFSRILLEDHARELAPDAQRYLGLVRENTRQMGQLVDDLLTFSRLGREPLRREVVASADLARQALEDVRAEREGRRVEIAVDPLPPCEGDPALLKQVWTNLLANALKFTRPREVARIEVGCRREEGTAVYFVRDNGVGFDMQYAGKLFGVFQRLHRAEEYEGTGVGLAIVQQIVHRHGGRVWAEAAVNRGATFYFTVGEEPRHD